MFSGSDVVAIACQSTSSALHVYASRQRQHAHTTLLSVVWQKHEHAHSQNDMEEWRHFCQ